MHAGSIREAYEFYADAGIPENKQRLSDALEIARRAIHTEQDWLTAWAWESGAFIGWTEDEARDYCRRIVDNEFIQPVMVETPRINRKEPIPTGDVYVYSEMKELIREMNAAHWQIWILSMSPRWLAEVVAEKFSIPGNRVLGMTRGLARHDLASPSATILLRHWQVVQLPEFCESNSSSPIRCVQRRKRLAFRGARNRCALGDQPRFRAPSGLCRLARRVRRKMVNPRILGAIK